MSKILTGSPAASGSPGSSGQTEGGSFFSDKRTWFTFGPAVVSAGIDAFVLWRDPDHHEWWNNLKKPITGEMPWMEWLLCVANQFVSAYSVYLALTSPGYNHEYDTQVLLAYAASVVANTATFVVLFAMHDLTMAWWAQLISTVVSVFLSFTLYRMGSTLKIGGEMTAFYLSLVNLGFNALSMLWMQSLYSKNKPIAQERDENT